MAFATLSKWGESLAIRIPRKIITDNGWKAGDVFEAVPQANGVLLKKVRKRTEYDIEKLLSGIDEFNPDEVASWNGALGREVW